MTGPVSKLDKLRAAFSHAESVRNSQIKNRPDESATPQVERDYQDALRRLREAETEALKDVAR